MQFIKKEYILGGDIGGTNTNLGVFGIKNNLPKLLLSFHFKSKELKNLYEAINKTLNCIQKKHNLKITKACFGIAGILNPSKDNAEITNISWNVSKKELFKKTKLNKIVLINDFEAVGYGINILAKKDILAIKNAKKVPQAPILVIGAGTGLGKTLLIYNEDLKFYMPIPSEAGHSDFAAQNQQEFGLINFIKKNKKIKQSISYEHVLSGQGLSSIYLFFRKGKMFKETVYTKEIDKSKALPELISKYRKIDGTCKAAFEIFKAIYAGFAKNFALDSLALGGVYIAGGIAIKNKEIFDADFVKLFENNYKMKGLLRRMPIYLILDYYAGLLGAGFLGAKKLIKD